MVNPKPLNPRLAKYVDYINNTAQVPLAVDDFDEDWKPIGPMVRAEMLEDGYIYMGGPGMFGETKEGIYLRPDLRHQR
jgi:hypothetical protein